MVTGLSLHLSKWSRERAQSGRFIGDEMIDLVISHFSLINTVD